jgi:hypothetical protein
MWHVLGRREGHTGFWWGKLRERDHLKDLGIEWDWTDLAEVKYKWRAVVNMAMNLRVP